MKNVRRKIRKLYAAPLWTGPTAVVPMAPRPTDGGATSMSDAESGSRSFAAVADRQRCKCVDESPESRFADAVDAAELGQRMACASRRSS
jgi:hypothetical protein